VISEKKHKWNGNIKEKQQDHEDKGETNVKKKKTMSRKEEGN
jgi:hypothetical protein